LGGLHDYIGVMNKNDIKKYIMAEAGEHKEINHIDLLNGLVAKFKINFTSRQDLTLDLALEDVPRTTLINYALTTEKYHRDINNLQLLGGLHDYVDTLSNKKLIEYIVKEANEHVELDTIEKLAQVAKEFGIEYVPHHY